MSKVAVVYWSGTGNTEAMAYYVTEGAKAAGAEVDVFTSAEFSDVYKRQVLSVSNASGYPVAEAMSIAVYLTTAVAQVNPQKSLERMENMEKLGDSLRAYI